MSKALALAAAVATIFPFGTVIADEHEQEERLQWRLVEGWTCTYQDGMGREDLDKVNAEWNKWMDEHGQDDYTAFLMTPQFFGEWNFDFAWIGVARDGHAFGKGTDLWQSAGGKVSAKFNEVITCSSHSAFVSTNIKRMPPSDEQGDGRFVLNFSNCSLENDGEGAFDEFRAAHKEWNAYADEHGYDYNAWLWWPMWGEADDSYDFKYVSAMSDYTTVGANWQLSADGHWQKSRELLGDQLDCDSSRIYDAEMIRTWSDE
jgi:hypothetical protein